MTSRSFFSPGTWLLAMTLGLGSAQPAQAGLVPWAWDALFGPPGSFFGYGYYGGYYGYDPYVTGYTPYVGGSPYVAGYFPGSGCCGGCHDSCCGSYCGGGCYGGHCPGGNCNVNRVAPSSDPVPDNEVPSSRSRSNSRSNDADGFGNPPADTSDPNWKPRTTPGPRPRTSPRSTDPDGFDSTGTMRTNKAELGEGTVIQPRKPAPAEETDPIDGNSARRASWDTAAVTGPSAVRERLARRSTFRSGSIVKVAATPRGDWLPAGDAARLADNR